MSEKQWQDRFYQLLENSEFETIAALTHAAGVSNGSFSRALKGQHTIKQTTLAKIANVLGCTTRFLLYGETEEAFYSIPLLSDTELSLWLSEQIETGQCMKQLAPPLEMGSMAFAWKNSCSDMEPAIPLGTLLYFDVGVEIADGDHYRPMYVLSGVTNPARPQTIRTTQTASQSPEPKYVDIVLSRMIRTMNGLKLVSEHPEWSDSIDVGDRILLAQLRHFLISL